MLSAPPFVSIAGGGLVVVFRGCFLMAAFFCVSARFVVGGGRLLWFLQFSGQSCVDFPIWAGFRFYVQISARSGLWDLGVLSWLAPTPVLFWRSFGHGVVENFSLLGGSPAVPTDLSVAGLVQPAPPPSRWW
jgi:hypothetical protein